MTTDRERILGRLQHAHRDLAAPAATRPHPALNPDPRSGMIEQMEKTHIGVAELASIDEVPGWVNGYAKKEQLPAVLVGGAALARLPWQAAGIQFEQRAALASDALAISEALCGIAESGTALVTSGPNNPSSLNFLPDHHVILLDAKAIVGYWEEAWQLCREAWKGQTPRATHGISGPSSTADVGMTQVFGAHGPRNLSVLLIG